jgi:phospholipid transport system transporter-binding protein
VSNAELVAQEAGQFTLSGALDFSTVDELLPRGLAMLEGTGPLMLDLAGVTRANSAGLVLLLEWQDQAQRRGRELHIRHLPTSLADIARISNCTELLPI